MILLKVKYRFFMNSLMPFTILTKLTKPSLYVVTIFIFFVSAVQHAPASAAYDCAMQSEISESECVALVAIYNSNPQATLHGWLEPGSSPCLWDGVYCPMNSDSVIYLHLFAKNLTTLPPEIGDLTNLARLDLSGNRLRNLPATIGNLRMSDYIFMSVLNLSYNELTTLPAELGNLHVSSLDLSNNELTTLPAELGNLHVSSLDLSDNGLTTLPGELGDLHVNSLDLSNNELTALPTGLGNLYVEDSLDLSNNKLTSLSSDIGDLTLGVRGELNLSHNNLATLPPEIGELTLLELNVSHNRLITLPPEIGSLDIEGYSVYTDTSEYYTPSRLDISHNRLIELPDEISELAVDTLNLSHNFLDSLPNTVGNLSLRILDLSHNEFTAFPSELSNLSIQGYTTNARNNPTNGYYPSELNIAHNGLAVLPDNIGNLTVDSLNLTHNMLSVLPLGFGDMPNLAELYLHDNEFVGAVPDSLLNLSLSYFTFYQTSWCVPDTPVHQGWLMDIEIVHGTGFICGLPLGAFAGQLTTLASSEPISGTQVNLYRRFDERNNTSKRHIATAYTDSEGYYTFDELGQDIEYFVEFSTLGGAYFPIYYDNQRSLETATPITVTLGVTETNISAILSQNFPIYLPIVSD